MRFPPLQGGRGHASQACLKSARRQPCRARGCAGGAAEGLRGEGAGRGPRASATHRPAQRGGVVRSGAGGRRRSGGAKRSRGAPAGRHRSSRPHRSQRPAPRRRLAQSLRRARAAAVAAAARREAAAARGRSVRQQEEERAPEAQGMEAGRKPRRRGFLAHGIKRQGAQGTARGFVRAAPGPAAAGAVAGAAALRGLWRLWLLLCPAFPRGRGSLEGMRCAHKACVYAGLGV
jgi:hypothetical protein